MKKTILSVILLITGITLSSQNASVQNDLVWSTSPSNPNWLYKTNEKASIDISLQQYGIPLDNTVITYSIGPELMPETQRGTVTLKKGKATLAVGTMSEPGFLDCRLTVKIGTENYKHHVKLGFSPEKLKAYTQMPKDFDNFWNKNLNEASSCPYEVIKTPAPQYSTDKVECFLVKIQTFKKGNYIYGYLTVPRKDGKFPVVIAPPGAGIKPMDPLKDMFYAENDVIRFDMEIHGIRPDLSAEDYKSISQSFGNGNNSYLVNGLDDKDNYYMKKVYVSMVRVVDFLTQLPQWDGKNVMAQGNSQGGALALIATALDKRITACAISHPALSDMAGYKANRAGGYPHIFTRFSGMDTPAKINTLSYYDVVNFASKITVPVFMTWGYNDDVCPPTTSYIVYNTLNCHKEALITPVNEHWISTTTRRSLFEWLKLQAK